MRRLLAILFAAGLLIAGVVAWTLPRSGADLPPPVPDGDREVAWIHAATSGASWERFVAGVHRARHDWPQLWVDDGRAFLDQTTAVPEVVLGVEGTSARLHIRWYKLTSATKSAFWVKKLATREAAPLAFIGGGTSDRAEELARALADEKANWHGPAPLLLITTATANTVGGDTGLTQTSLTDLYKGRTFRFCFTNEQMARAVVDFLWSRPNLRPTGDPLPALTGLGPAAAGPLAAAISAARAGESPPVYYALSWDDDPYSSDLASQFHAAFHEPQWPRIIMGERRGIPFSVGDVYRPNAWEALAADKLVQELKAAPLERRVLVLPAGAAQARRVLRALTGAMPFVGRNVVAVSGDSINVNNVYRDAELAWNIRSIPVPLVFFAHQNPTAWDVEPNSGRLHDPARSEDPGVLLPPTATDDVLLHAFLVRLLVESAYAAEPGRALTDSPEALADRLRDRRPAVFDAGGDRLPGKGEYVVALLPRLETAHGETEVLSSAVLEVWTRDATSLPAGWKLMNRLVSDHARRPEPNP